MVLGALMAWGPLDTIPRWVGLGTLFVGGLLVAVALGIYLSRSVIAPISAMSLATQRIADKAKDMSSKFPSIVIKND